jgi:hypothetical protein
VIFFLYLVCIVLSNENYYVNQLHIVIVLLIILLIVGVLIDNKAFVVVVVLRFIIPLIKGVFDLQFDQRKNRTVS